MIWLRIELGLKLGLGQSRGFAIVRWSHIDNVLKLVILIVTL